MENATHVPARLHKCISIVAFLCPDSDFTMASKMEHALHAAQNALLFRFKYSNIKIWMTPWLNLTGQSCSPLACAERYPYEA